MQLNDQTPAIGKPELLRPYQWLTAATALFVLLQAVLASQWLFKGEADLLEIHEIIANIFFLVVIIQTGMTIMLRFRGAFGRQLLMLNGLLVVLTLAQTGLGYSGRESADAKAWHVPLGVFLFGLAVAIAAMASRPPED